MTANLGYVAPTTEPTRSACIRSTSSCWRFPTSMPRRTSTGFGLDVARDGNALAIKTFGHEHRWGSVIEGKTKALHHLSFGCYAEDLPRLKARIEGAGVRLVDGRRASRATASGSAIMRTC